MSSLVIALTLVCVLAISTGQLMFKKAAQAMPDVLSLSALLHNGWLIASLVLYGVTTLGWGLKVSAACACAISTASTARTT